MAFDCREIKGLLTYLLKSESTRPRHQAKPSPVHITTLSECHCKEWLLKAKWNQMWVSSGVVTNSDKNKKHRIITSFISDITELMSRFSEAQRTTPRLRQVLKASTQLSCMINFPTWTESRAVSLRQMRRPELLVRSRLTSWLTLAGQLSVVPDTVHHTLDVASRVPVVETSTTQAAVLHHSSIRKHPSHPITQLQTFNYAVVDDRRISTVDVYKQSLSLVSIIALAPTFVFAVKSAPFWEVEWICLFIYLFIYTFVYLILLPRAISLAICLSVSVYVYVGLQ